jgi:hypothetical protein
MATIPPTKITFEQVFNARTPTEREQLLREHGWNTATINKIRAISGLKPIAGGDVRMDEFKPHGDGTTPASSPRN